MFKKRLIRFIVAHVFDQLSRETLNMVNDCVDQELLERRNEPKIRQKAG